MKIQCDVCEKEEAIVFCSADEAALCQGCDRRVHHANKLASKHLRFSLNRPSSKESPRCDICQEKRALLFCQQDRAILCKECDVTIHKTNEYTKKHTRFLLTGVKLSAAASPYQSSSSPSSSIGSKMSNSINNASMMTYESTSAAVSEVNSCNWGNQQGQVSGSSSISEYLMETLPGSGWHVEDLLDASCSPYAFCKTNNELSLPLTNEEFERSFGFFPSNNDSEIWLPQTPGQYQYGDAKGSVEMNNNLRISRERSENGFTVPQVNLVKRSRQF